MRKGLIIAGYPAVGKSSCAGRKHCVDLESSLFKDKVFGFDVYGYTVNAIHLANQGYTVFVSTHAGVIEQILACYNRTNDADKTPRLAIFCPTLTMKNVWIARATVRYKTSGMLEKDRLALKRIEENFEEDIRNLYRLSNMYKIPLYQPYAIDYDLMNYVHKIRRDLCKKEKL